MKTFFDRLILTIGFIVFLPIALPVAILQNLGILGGVLYEIFSGEYFRNRRARKGN